MKKQSKFLSLVLRHQPEVAGLTLDAEGWVSTSDVVHALRTKFGQFSHEDLAVLVRDNDKQRFIISGNRIRANQGHSIAVDLGLEPKTPPQTLYHGTKRQFVGSIFEKGLLPGSRQHVHLSATLDTAEIVANRRAGESVILVVDTTGLGPFYQSENGVWLTDSVPPSHLSVLPSI